LNSCKAMVYSFVKENKLMVALAILLAVIAGVSTLWDFQTKASAQGNGNNNQASEEEDEGNGNGNGNQVSAGELCGFAWGAEGASVSSGSRNGVGWVSFNSQDCDPNNNGAFDDGVPGCPSNGTTFHEYHVSVDSDRYLDGYAWSSNLGWLKFDEELHGPNGAGNGTTAHGARVQNESGNSNVRGWARFCEGTNPDDCSETSRTDGWDGWVSLEGSGYGVTYTESTQKFADYSWGGPVVGWLKWDQTDGTGVRYCAASTFTASLVAYPSSGAAPLNSVLTANPTGASYEFACKSTDSLSAPQSSNTYNCQYTTAGQTYVARVKVTSGSQNATAYTTVTTDSDGGPGPGNGALSATCFIVDAQTGDYVVDDQAMVNRPVEWKANVSIDGTADGPFNYSFSFDDNGSGSSDTDFGGTGDGPDQIFNGVSAPNQTASRTYRILGRKYARVTVSDPVEGVDSGVVNCTPIPLNVVVNPRIIEI
jgi:hypothetical protein